MKQGFDHRFGRKGGFAPNPTRGVAPGPHQGDDPPGPALIKNMEKQENIKNLGWWAVVALTLWMALHMQPALWLQPSWPTGGDVASHLLYVGVFKEWFLEHGKISGWLPEVFAGFPALTYYFPLPFVWMAVASLVVGLPLAFKWVVLLPAFLLPSALYWSTGRMGWPPPARLLGATATVGFLVNESSSIWGGNLLAQFSGEFAYSWGLLWAVLFWGLLGRLLRQGGRGWFFAALLVEIATALSHGFAILMVGFGSLCYLLLSGGGWRALWILLRLHLLAFLLLGFWLLPLLANHGWTIPNDTLYPIGQWLHGVWPVTVWWVMGGVPALLFFLLRRGAIRLALLPFLAMGLTGLMGTLVASPLGLANVRFLPYLQLGGALLLAGALGWWLQCGYRFQYGGGTTAPPSDQRLAMTLALLLTLGVAHHWEGRIYKIPIWSYTYFTGYEGRSQWTIYQQLAERLRGGLASPRILFEHDPANRDLGSTRTLEALPFFGSRPVLEGLYMESAISAPFIYQLQSEVSLLPSGPLSRYPPQSGSVTAAVNHMRELGADTLLLRSASMKERFGSDPRFVLEATVGPFSILRLAEGTAPLVALLQVPLQTRARAGWLDQAYNRFITDHPYTVRQVYIEQEAPLPEPVGGCQGGSVRLEGLEREELVVITDRPGCPHLLRMSYHPKWQARTGETIYLVDPFFMLVFPQQERLELRYSPGPADRLGWILTALGGILSILLLRSRWAGSGEDAGGAWFGGEASTRRVMMGWGAVAGILVAGWYGQRSVDEDYQRGQALFDQQHYAMAATHFEQAVHHRRGWARQAEALFWAGLAQERANHPESAQHHYQQLIERYPAAHFSPEALYRLSLLHRQRGETERAEALLRDLTVRYPVLRWPPQVRKLFHDAIPSP